MNTIVNTINLKKIAKFNKVEFLLNDNPDNVTGKSKYQKDYANIKNKLMSFRQPKTHKIFVQRGDIFAL